MPQYAPPSGPPPAYQPLSAHGGNAAPTQQPGGYPPPSTTAPGGWQQQAPYPPQQQQQAPYPPQSSYPPPAGPPPGQQAQQGQYAPLRQGTVGSYGAPPAAGASTNPFADAAASSAPLGRQDSIQAHARRMSNDLAKQQQLQQQGAGAVRASSVKENPLDLLKSFDTIFIVDDSSSMNVNERPDGSMGQSRWEEARDALAGLVEIASKYDDDGVDIHFLNSDKSLEGCRDPNAVRHLFDSLQPEGFTPTGERLEMLLLEYMDAIEQYKATRKGKEPKKRNIIIITDGAPSDDPESVIVAIARRLDEGRFPLAQIGLQFLQVGHDQQATEALQELDDNLSKVHKTRDLVDTVPYSGVSLSAENLIKALLGGINRRLDRKSTLAGASGSLI